MYEVESDGISILKRDIKRLQKNFHKNLFAHNLRIKFFMFPGIIFLASTKMRMLMK